ncbi:hypothetical protein EV191_107178 [Tamaricihabitans halophyticus]|uniref:Uncharacterized protein n=2 Tax=Tamaricihabitans halophyticus TaxID=1262583 RepID=A0A4R2QPM5_9PSEU|nr:hypothetical protein EV191_107178 [Tamaricihabitans halophyticus]
MGQIGGLIEPAAGLCLPTTLPRMSAGTDNDDAQAPWSGGAAIGSAGWSATTLGFGVFTLLTALMGWAAWLLVVAPVTLTSGGGWFAYAPATVGDSAVPYSFGGAGILTTLVGGVWLALVPVAGVGLVVARHARGRVPALRVRAGTITCVVGLLLAVAGAFWWFMVSTGAP